jgi:DNA-binding Lrp family transcriptional regulator
MSVAGSVGGRSARDAVASALETGLSISPSPFLEIARAIGISEERVLSISRDMIGSGFIRRLGAFFDLRRLGLKGYLFGAELPGGRSREVISLVGGMSCVTHSYARRYENHGNHALGLWFTAVLGGDGEARAIGDAMRGLGLAFVALDVRERIKLRPSFAGTASEPPRPEQCGGAGAAVWLDGRRLDIARALQDRFSVSSRPFAVIAESLGMGGRGEERVLGMTASLRDEGVLRRIGASLNHNMAGWAANSLTAWDVSHLSGREASSLAAESVRDRPWASHCYLRSVIDRNLIGAWPYDLYIMIHARTEEELEERERILAGEIGTGPGLDKFISMRTEAEYKKISFKI